MLKKTIEYKTVEHDEIVDSEVDVRFMYGISPQKLYEQNYSKSFWGSFEKASIALSQLLTKLDISKDGEVNQSDMGEMLPVLTNEDINSFFQDMIPCLYLEIQNGRIVQNQETFETAQESEWINELIDIRFYIDLFFEMSLNKMAEVTKKKTPKKKTNSKKL